MGNLTGTQLFIQLSIALILGGSLAYLLWKQRQQAKGNSMAKTKAEDPAKSFQLQLQAYERLILIGRSDCTSSCN